MVLQNGSKVEEVSIMGLDFIILFQSSTKYCKMVQQKTIQSTKTKKQKQKKIGHLLRSFEWGASAEFNKKSCSEAAPKLLRICTGNENDHLDPPKNYRSKTKRKKKKIIDQKQNEKKKKNSDTSKPNLKTSGTSSAPF